MLLSRVPFKQKSHGVSSLLPYICSFHILLHLCTYLLYFTKRIANSESMARRHSGCKIQKLGWDCTVKLDKFRGHAPHENATLKSKIGEFGVIEQFCATCWVSIREEWLSIFVIFELLSIGYIYFLFNSNKLAKLGKFHQILICLNQRDLKN